MTASKTTVNVTLKRETYELDLQKLTGRERLDAKRLLEVEAFHTGLLLADEIGHLVLGYLAARRMNPGLSFDDVLELSLDEITIEFPDGNDDQPDPFAGSATKASRPKASSSRQSSEA